MLNVAAWNSLDWVLILVLIFSTARACMRGVVQALFGLVGFLAGFEVASWNYNFVGNWIYRRDWISTMPIARIVAFLLIAITVAIVIDIAGRRVKRTIHAIGLGFADRFLGGVFGFARGILAGVALIVAVVAFGTHGGWVEKSKLSSLFLDAAHALSFVVPHSLH